MLQILTTLIFTVVLVGSAVGDRISDSGRSVFVKVMDNAECTQLYSCKDCNTARICRPTGPGKWQEVTSIKCPAAMPYCESKTGTCTPSPDPSCGNQDVFLCPREKGYFPDVTNTSLYHVCENYVASQFACADKLQYNPLSEDCEPSKVERTPLSCGADGRKVAFPDFPTYFVYCYSNTPTIVDRCVGNYELNMTSQSCEATCHGDGILRDYEECTMYYRCRTLYFTRETRVTLKERLSCPKGQGFYPAMYMCAPLNIIDGCFPPTTPVPPTPAPTSSGTTSEVTTSAVPSSPTTSVPLTTK